MGKHLEKNIKKISIKNELNSAIAQTLDKHNIIIIVDAFILLIFYHV
jgi:hypothetical protein